jgi:5-methyltetrahydropteroyltriglutamate--homocysteine methyltransferase
MMTTTNFVAQTKGEKMSIKTLITGFTRIGKNRELKKALESYWESKTTAEQLQETSSLIRKEHWLLQKRHKIDLISVNDFSLYDNMLDTAIMINAIPERFISISNEIERYFVMARGNVSNKALEMTKWFNTNYHYIVPELNDEMSFRLNASKIISEYKEAKSIGITPKINIIGPVTFLGLSKDIKGKSCYLYFDKVIEIYKDLINTLSEIDDTIYIQFDEPLFVKETTKDEQELLKKTYSALSVISNKIKIIVTTYFEHSVESVNILGGTDIWGIGLDFVHGKKNIEALDLIKNKKLIAGIVDGRNIWISDIANTLTFLDKISAVVPKENIIVSTSCSLLHVPYSVKNEPENHINNHMSFACEKVEEISLISRLFHEKQSETEHNALLQQNSYMISNIKKSDKIHNPKVEERINNIKTFERKGTFDERIQLQKEKLKLPILPTTTIGSFPQTDEIRQIRRRYKRKEISQQDYDAEIKKHIDNCIVFQEEVGLDILVHGEPERNDMVEYFGELLEGFHFTQNGWVQSYGSRCVKPPVIFGDIYRLRPMTVEIISYAQSKTKKIMKGMLTGPVTILNWSFVRNDKKRSEVAKQLALALNDEINDLQNAGIRIIQVDEAAFKEGYPLRKDNISLYEQWATESFKLAVSCAKKETQIHTHMCYSEFNEIIKTLEAMDADVITIETARSGNELLKAFKKNGYKNEIGPGVYDIHSSRVPSIEDFIVQIKTMIDIIPINKLWINPDCGLKTRKWEEVKIALKNMVEATKKIRVL